MRTRLTPAGRVFGSWLFRFICVLLASTSFIWLLVDTGYWSTCSNWVWRSVGSIEWNKRDVQIAGIILPIFLILIVFCRRELKVGLTRLLRWGTISGLIVGLLYCGGWVFGYAKYAIDRNNAASSMPPTASAVQTTSTAPPAQFPTFHWFGHSQNNRPQEPIVVTAPYRPPVIRLENKPVGTTAQMGTTTIGTTTVGTATMGTTTVGTTKVGAPETRKPPAIPSQPKPSKQPDERQKQLDEAERQKITRQRDEARARDAEQKRQQDAAKKDQDNQKKPDENKQQRRAPDEPKREDKKKHR